MKAGLLFLILAASVSGVKFAEEEAFKDKTISFACLTLVRTAIVSETEFVEELSTLSSQTEVVRWYVMNGMETCVELMDYALAVEIFYKESFRAKHYNDFYTLDFNLVKSNTDWTLTPSQLALLEKLKTFA